MGKVFSRIFKGEGKPNEMAAQDIQKILGQNNACYVLITCGSPSEDGKMQVEMTYGGYGGDESFAAYLIESAQGFIGEEENVH